MEWVEFLGYAFNLVSVFGFGGWVFGWMMGE